VDAVRALLLEVESVDFLTSCRVVREHFDVIVLVVKQALEAELKLFVAR